MARRTTLILLTAILFLVAVPVTFARLKDNPPPQPGWIHAPSVVGGNGDDSPQRHGIALDGGKIRRGSPVIADIDGNPANGNEVAIGSSDGSLHVYRSNGQLLWRQQVTTCSVDAISAAPAVGMLDGQQPYVVIGYGPASRSANCDGGVAAYRGRDGNAAWRFSTRDWNRIRGGNEDLFGVLSSPALADTDGDGVMEVGFGGLDRNVYLLNGDGSVRWYLHAADTVRSSPAFVDIDGDRRLEMLIGTDISENRQVAVPTSNGGYVYAFDTTPRSQIEYGFFYDDSRKPDIVRWRTTLDQVIFSSPTIADLLPDQPGLELAIGSGCFFPAGRGVDKTGSWVKILRLRDGAVLQTLNAPECVQSSPAVGDLDDDGKLEIAVTVGSSLDSSDPLGRVVAWDPENPTPKWSVAPFNPNSSIGDRPIGNDPDGGDLQSAVIADVDGNGSLEVVVANFWSVHIFNGRDGRALTCQSSACGAEPSLFAWGTLKSTPAVGDLDGDGNLEIVIGGEHVNIADRGVLYAWTDLAAVINSSSGSQTAYAAPWPMFRGNANHTGVFAQPRIIPSVAAVSALITPDQRRSYSITLDDAASGALPWTAQVVDDTQGLLNLARASGTTGEALVVTINPAAVVTQMTTGIYTAQVVVQSPGLADVAIPFTITVVDDVNSLYLPLTVR